MNSSSPLDHETNRHTPNHADYNPQAREITNTGIQREATLMSICSYRTDSRLSTNASPSKMLNLGMFTLTAVESFVLLGCYFLLILWVN